MVALSPGTWGRKRRLGTRLVPSFQFIVGMQERAPRGGREGEREREREGGRKGGRD